jgi:nucleoside-diphosphate-sugar epimerase
VKTALVTGSAGLIGRHFCEYLFGQGWDVCPLDINSPNLASRGDAREFFRNNDFCYDLVVHCAAHVGGRLDIENKAAYIGAYNVQLDGAMFEYALRTLPAHVVYWSSSAAYPVADQLDDANSLTLRETDIYLREPEAADQTYGWAKLVGERLAQEVQAEGIKVHVFRPFSGWTDDQDISYPMGAFLDRARRKADPFDIWGDGEQVRDFIHISDIIGATMAAIDLNYSGPLNLCTGVPTSFNELADLVTSAGGYRPALKHHLDKPQGVRYRVGDPTELHKVWQPRVSLEEGIKRSLAGRA